jgi:hypothetical protein
MRPTNEPIEKKVETNKQPARPLCIVVLGMHRSGTSVLTGVLGLLGARLPKKLLPANGTNPKGFFEPNDIVELHDEMLSALGSSWADYRRLEPARFNSAAAAPFKARLVAALRAEYDNATMFVVKDPRICRFFPLWRDAANIFGAETRALLVIRNPLEVAWSLAQRDGLPHGYGLRLWLRHVLDSEFDTRHSPRAFVTYGDFMRDWTRVIEKSKNELGIALLDTTLEVRAEVDALIDRDLRHYDVDEETFAVEYGDNPLVLKTYRALKALVTRSSDADAMKMLDEVRETFDEGIRARGYQIDGDLISVLTKLHSAHGRITQLENQASLVGPLQIEFNSAQARVSDLERTLSERSEEIVRLNGQIQAQASIIESSQSEIRSAHARMSDLERTLLERSEEVVRLNGQIQAQASIIESSQSEIRSAHARTSNLEVMLAGRTKEAERLNGRLLSVQKNLTKIAASNFLSMADQERQKNQIRQIELEVNLMKRSLSWRLGKPLRVFAAKFPRIMRVSKRLFGL